jgi:uncharacterized membrane protein SpoIIM required for sporulation
MVLESILTPAEVEKQPIDMLIMGFVTSSVALWLAYYIFPQGASHWALFLTTLAVVPLILRVLDIEETKEVKLAKESLWQRHDEVIFMYLFLFFGMILSFSFWFVILPQGLVEIMFKEQIAELGRLEALRATLSGNIMAPVGATLTAAIMSKKGILNLILANNLRLLFLFVAFSFVYGTGAILLLTWNAAIVGAAVGSIIRETVSVAGSIFLKTSAYFTALPGSISGFLVHGIFEVLGYFIGAVAGGIMSVAIVRQHYKSAYFKRIIKDVAILIGVAVILIIVGAYMEVYITPAL